MKLPIRETVVATILAAVLLMLGSAVALAQVQNGQQDAVLCLHAQAHNTKGVSCGDSPEAKNVGCQDYVDQWEVGVGADVFLILAEGDSSLGIAGISCGIAYSNNATLADGVGVDMFGYTFCSDLEYTNSPDGNSAHEWPYSGGGNRLIWLRDTNCQRHVIPPHKVHATACVFYVYAYGPDLLQITKNIHLESGPEMLAVDCRGPANSDLDYPNAAGAVSFGTASGARNPCTDPDVPVKGTTWGRLKNQYRN